MLVDALIVSFDDDVLAVTAISANERRDQDNVAGIHEKVGIPLVVHVNMIIVTLHDDIAVRSVAEVIATVRRG